MERVRQRGESSRGHFRCKRHVLHNLNMLIDGIISDLQVAVKYLETGVWTQRFTGSSGENNSSNS